MRSSSFTWSSTPSRVPISMRYSISSPVTDGPALPLPTRARRRLVSLVTPLESGHSTKHSARTTGRKAKATCTGCRLAHILGTISPRKSTAAVMRAVVTATAVAADIAVPAATSSAMAAASAPAPTFTSVFPMRSVERTRSGCSIHRLSRRARRPPPSRSCRARASPRDVRAVSVLEQNAEPARNTTASRYFHTSAARRLSSSCLENDDARPGGDGHVDSIPHDAPGARTRRRGESGQPRARACADGPPPAWRGRGRGSYRFHS